MKVIDKNIFPFQVNLRTKKEDIFELLVIEFSKKGPKPS